ncbi:L,D-transpeptidase family protein [Rubrivirga marina]|uniref:Uncharacterized protein n=1 Tax=Rubrivirga marina TaxID=1196024 RepID=A0A271IZ49_9BACT|nr:L,D-transpeptidase family protein [Rubrivirga marina]PAP76516.1 hypothetical protein BSZ37_08710 [Rubrivirga marina]
MRQLAVLVLLVAPALASAQASREVSAVGAPAPVVYDVDAAPAYYVTERGVALREAPHENARTLATLRTRDGVRVLAEDGAPADGFAHGWRLVQWGETRGYVRAGTLSNVWIRVDKSERMTYVYRGAELLREFPADVSVSPEDKVRRSGQEELEHYRIPEGTFFVTRLNPNSSYYRAFVLSYPGPAHALRGVRDGIITQAQYEAIARADREGLEPPMNTALGGLIEIHGHGSGRQRAWTRGCVALRNVHMDELWAYVEVGTPVVIEP